MHKSCRFLSFIGSLTISAALLQAQAPTPAPTAWTPCGWGGGGFYYAAAFHPAQDGVIYLGGDVNGMARSDDHGRSWRLINNGLAAYGVFSIAVDRMHPQTVYAATDEGLCKSTDNGEHWTVLPHTGPKELRITGEKGKSIRAVAVDPTDSNIVYAASPAGKVYKSADAGQTWKAIYTSPQPQPASIYSICVSLRNPLLVLAATGDSGLILSRDAGNTWTQLSTPKKASSVAVSDSDASIIYASFFKDGIWKSADQGKTWTDVSSGLGKDSSITEVVISPANPLEVHAVASQGWSGCAFSSTDGGKTWKSNNQIIADSEGDPTLPKEHNGTIGLSIPTNLTINPSNPRELYISANWRSCWSDNGGVTWAERERGADISCITDIRFSGSRTYVTVMDEGTLVSDNDGQSWKQLWPLKWDAAISGHNWRVAITPHDGTERIISTVSPWDKYPPRIVVSEDAGKSFKIATAGLPDYIIRPNTMWGQGHPRALAVDPKHTNVVYLGIDGDPAAGKSGGGIFKSADGGYTWSQLVSQPGSRRMYYGLAVDPTDSNRIFWASCGTNGGLHATSDGGASWKRVFSQEQWLWNVLVTADGTVYCTGTNLWKSTDHGATWKPLTHFTNGRAMVGLEVHPHNSNIIWISQNTWDGSTTGGVYKTSDGGATWQEITGDLPCRKPQLLRFNPETNELWAGDVGLFRTKQ